MDLEEREGGTQKESGEKKKGHTVKISCLESMEAGRNGQKQRKECLEGKVLTTLYNFFNFFFAFSSKCIVGQRG